jgi:Sulfatase
VRIPLRRPIPFHPFGLAAVPLLILYARNVREGASIHDVVGPILLVLAVTAGVTILATLAFRGNARRGALVATALVVLFFAFGPVTNALGATTTSQALTVGFAVALAVGAAVLVARATADGVAGWTKVLNVVALALVLINVGSAAVAAVRTGGSIVTSSVLSVRGKNERAAPGARDIVYIVLDDYGGERSMRELLGYDNEPFLEALRARGFFVPEHPTTNYPHTADALGAELNLDYVQRLLRDPPQDDWTPANALLKQDVVPKILKQHGYRYVHIGSWWEPTASNPQADVNVKMRGAHSEFTNAFIAQTLPDADTGPFGKLTFGEQEFFRVKFQLQQLEDSAKLPGATFVFAHLLVPHRPFVFALDGHYVDNDERAEHPDAQNYIDQLRYLNRQILRVIDRLNDVAAARRPVIVLQSDEGFYSGLDEESDDVTDALLEQHFGILEAFSFPGLSRTGLYDTITPVNVFRLLFDDYLGARLPLLPDRNYVFRDTPHLYDFIDVTDRVRALS